MGKGDSGQTRWGEGTEPAREPLGEPRGGHSSARLARHPPGVRNGDGHSAGGNGAMGRPIRWAAPTARGGLASEGRSRDPDDRTGAEAGAWRSGLFTGRFAALTRTRGADRAAVTSDVTARVARGGRPCRARTLPGWGCGIPADRPGMGARPPLRPPWDGSASPPTALEGCAGSLADLPGRVLGLLADLPGRGAPGDAQPPFGEGPIRTVRGRCANLVRLALRGWARVAEWQTRTVQVRVSERTWRFNSSLAHRKVALTRANTDSWILSRVSFRSDPNPSD